ncbi:MAG: transposase [Deltaproteobacteria bacterium]|nr:transposase [Deltaproteobacteria bacterium]
MAVIYPHFLQAILAVHDRMESGIAYPFFDSACACYEALRAVRLDGLETVRAIEKYGLTEYWYRKCLAAFNRSGVAGLIGLESGQLTEELSVEAERMVFVLKAARPWIPATKMRIILQGFDYDISLPLMRHLYASYGWAQGTKPYQKVDFRSLNLKVMQLCVLQNRSIARKSFLHAEDHMQGLLEVFRTLHARGVTKRYPGSRVSFGQHKEDFLSLGLLGLIERARPAFRNSKVGFREEGRLILSKIQHPTRGQAHYQRILQSKKIEVDPTCVTKIFTRWKVNDFRSRFKGDLQRLLVPEVEAKGEEAAVRLPVAMAMRLDRGFVSFLKQLPSEPIALANPGLFLFLPYLDRLRIFDKAASLFDIDPDRGYSWFSLLLLSLGRVLQGLSSVSKACRTHELSLPLAAGLVGMPSKDSLLNGLAVITEGELLSLRRHLTKAIAEQGLIKAKRIAFDFHMRDFTADDVPLKNIGKGPSPKRKICFPGFRPHLAWDVDTGLPIALEFRNGSARATTTIRRFIRELLSSTLGEHIIEHVYLDSEYTGGSVWRFIVDSEQGLGADLTMCIKQNPRVKQYMKAFLETKPTWLFYDEEHTYTEQTFTIPIRQTDKSLKCVLKRKESTGALRCFGSTVMSLDGRAILSEYGLRWIIENGIKDLVENYFFDNNPGIDPHRINIHYFIVTLARSLYEMLCRDYREAQNPDGSKKTIGTLRSEFMMGANAVLCRKKDELILTWMDAYPEKYHEPIKALLHKLNESKSRQLPFLGDLKIRFEIVPPRPEAFRNQFRRQHLEI